MAAERVVAAAMRIASDLSTVRRWAGGWIGGWVEISKICFSCFMGATLLCAMPDNLKIRESLNLSVDILIESAPFIIFHLKPRCEAQVLQPVPTRHGARGGGGLPMHQDPGATGMVANNPATTLPQNARPGNPRARKCGNT